MHNLQQALAENKHLRGKITPHIRLSDLSAKETQSLGRTLSDGLIYAPPPQITSNLWQSSIRMRWARNAARMGHKGAYRVLAGQLDKRKHLKDQSTEEIINMDDLKSWFECRKQDWSGSDADKRSALIIIIIIMFMFINCNWVVTRWQWLFYMYTEYEIGY